MATTLYVNPHALPTITPAFDAPWDQTTGMVRRSLFFDQQSTGLASVDFPIAYNDATNPFAVGMIQLISPPLRAGALAGTLVIPILAIESNAAANLYAECHVRLMSGDGATSRGDLLNVINVTEFDDGTPTNRRWSNNALSSQTAQDGDVIVIDLGYNGQNGNAVEYTGTITLNGGEVGGNVIVSNETGTDDYTNRFVFSQTLNFLNTQASSAKLGRRTWTRTATGTGAGAAVVTLTLPAVRGARHAITGIQIYRATDANVGQSAPLVITSMNLGGLSWTVGNVHTDGTTITDVDMKFNNPLMSDLASQPTTIVLPPPGTGVIWNAHVTYFTTPGN